MRLGAWCLVLGAWCVVAGCGRPKVERIEWPVMGTIAAVQFHGAIPRPAAELHRGNRIHHRPFDALDLRLAASGHHAPGTKH